MQSFKLFLESKASEEDKNIRSTLKNLPIKHRDLVKGFEYEFQLGNTLDRDDNHVGFIDDDQKKIVIAAPWYYGREFTFLHEIAHKVWAYLLTKETKSQWKNIVKDTKGSRKESAEELFCMVYANYYSKNKLKTFDKSQWNKFIKGLS